MLKALALIAALAVPSAALAQAAPPPEPIRVMIVGTVHFGNPGQDLNNVAMDPVTTPAKQAELAAVAEALARFRPTAVAVERQAADPATLLDARYPAFTPAMLLTNPDERYQVAYRLAHNAGLDRVYAIDEQGGEGRRDYFPFDKVSDWFEAHGSLSFYYGLLTFGDGVEQPGANLNAGWYERNARIFVKLMTVARPGDRIVVVFGVGHAYWLRHFVENTPGFELVDPVPYLAGS